MLKCYPVAASGPVKYGLWRYLLKQLTAFSY